MADTAIISTFAALAGSAVGALAPVLSNYVMQNAATRRELLSRQIADSEALYGEFIQISSSLFGHSMTHDIEEIDRIVVLYALVARIRLLGSKPVIAAAEGLARQIVLNYGEPNLTPHQLRAAVLSGQTDPLYPFSACLPK